MIVDRQPDIEGVRCRGFGVTWYQGYSLIFQFWHIRISWRPW